MDRPLVVTDPADGAVGLIEEAGELAAATDSPLTVLSVVTSDEYQDEDLLGAIADEQQHDADISGAIADVEGSSHTVGPAEYAEEIAETAITDVLDDETIETEAAGRYVEAEGDRVDAILEVAAEHDCDYVFLMGRRRSPAGKAIFGDTAQRVILNFDGYVVTTAR